MNIEKLKHNLSDSARSDIDNALMGKKRLTKKRLSVYIEFGDSESIYKKVLRWQSRFEYVKEFNRIFNTKIK